jgi:hypothetical protein
LIFIGDPQIAVLTRLLNSMRQTRDRRLLYAPLRRLTDLLVSRSPEPLLESLAGFYPVLKGIPGTYGLPGISAV